MAYDSNHGMLVVSKPSSNQLFPGCGLVKVRILYTSIILLAHMPQSHKSTMLTM